MNGPEVYATVFALGAVEDRRQRALGGIGRRAGARHAQRRQDLDERHAEGHAGVRPRQHHRRVGVRRRHGVRRGQEAAARRPVAVHLPHARLRQARGRRSSTASKPNDYVHAVREDHKRRGLLYAGTQHGVYYSYDDGDDWHSLSLNLPDVPVADSDRRGERPRDRDARAAFYVLDDIGPLRQFGAAGGVARPTCTCSCPTTRSDRSAARRSGTGSSSRSQNLTIEILDKAGTVVRDVRARQRRGRSRRAAGRGGRRRRGRRRRRRAAAEARGGGFAARRRRAQQRDLGPALPGRDVVPRHDPLGRQRDRARSAPPGTYTVRLTADGRDADAAAPRAAQSPLHGRHATPTCRRSSTSRFRFATRRAKRTTP